MFIFACKEADTGGQTEKMKCVFKFHQRNRGQSRNIRITVTEIKCYIVLIIPCFAKVGQLIFAVLASVIKTGDRQIECPVKFLRKDIFVSYEPREIEVSLKEHKTRLVSPRLQPYVSIYIG